MNRQLIVLMARLFAVFPLPAYSVSAATAASPALAARPAIAASAENSPLLIAALGAFAGTPAQAAGDDNSLTSAKQSKIIPLTLPSGALRPTNEEDVRKFTDFLHNIAEANKGRMESVEVLLWEAGDAPRKAMPNSLKAAGYVYAPKPSLDMADMGKMTTFTAAASGGRRGLIGIWLESKEVTALAWGVFVPAGSNEKSGAKSSSEAGDTTARSANAAANAISDAHEASSATPSSGGNPAPDALIVSVASTETTVNVMKNAKPPIPAFPKLALKPGYARGYVYDTKGKPLVGARIGVRSTAAGGFYSGASGKTDARGYYEIAAPWGVAHFYNAGYAVDYGEGRAALGLYPADGEVDSFATTTGVVENWVLVPYGITDRDAVQDNPRYCNNYFGGDIVLGYDVDSGEGASGGKGVPANAELELTLTPDGPLLDGSKGRTIIIRKNVGTIIFGQLYINNIPVGAYRVTARAGGKVLRLRETGPYRNKPFGLEPKEATGSANLFLRASSAKADMVIAGKGDWDQISVTLEMP